MRDRGCDDFERRETGGQAGVPSRDGAGSATVRHATGVAKKELFAVKGRKRSSALTRSMRSSPYPSSPETAKPQTMKNK